MNRKLSKKAEKWIEDHARKQAERDTKEWKNIQIKICVESTDSDFMQGDLDEYCSDLEELGLEYRAKREAYWREEFCKIYLELKQIIGAGV